MLPLVLLLAACGGGGVHVVPESEASIVMNLTNAQEGDTVKLSLFKDFGATIEPLETALVQSDGKVTFAYVATEPSIVRAVVDQSRAMNLIVEPGDKPVVDGELTDFGAVTVAGSEESVRYQRFNAARLQHNQTANPQDVRTVQSANGVLMRSLLDLMREKPGSVVSLLCAGQMMQLNNGQIPSDFFDLYDSILQGTEAYAAGSPQYVAINSYLAPVRKTMPGQPAPELIYNDPSGNPVALSSLQGKVVLIDFWASWCRPCRAENPNVVRLYNEYKDKGFEIYSVSLDKNRGKWEDAIAADNLQWTHVSDLQGWGSTAAKEYAVSSIPKTFLVGRDGVILETGLRGKALEDKLAELFGT